MSQGSNSMPDSLPSIDLNLPQKMRDKGYRQRFFIAESSAEIARQLVRLRKRRSLSQSQLAKMADMAQPRISKVERADYRNWSFNTLRRLAEAMDARIRVVIEPAEDILDLSDEPRTQDR
jgi:predicted XRE-type DNA-binding protein